VKASSVKGCRVALFDMDRTLVRTDTATLYVRYQRRVGEAGVRDVARVAYWMVQYTLGIIDAEAVASAVAVSYRGRSEAAMVERCRAWFRSDVLPHVGDAARAAVARHRSLGHVTAIVTGATRYAAEPLAEELGIEHVLATRLAVDGDAFTGEVVRPMCYGAGKIALAEELGERLGFSLGEAAFYSDSITDRPLLERVGHPVVVNPDARLRLVARLRGWPVERW
jgi:HAD superfamily hydrolase (TIGR01490 family)